MAQYTLNLTKFKSAVPNTAVSIIFTDIAVPSGITATDISADSDSSVVAWLNNNVYYVSTKVTG